MFDWDHRNRLASVSDYDDTHALQQKFSYIYDAFDRLVGKRSDTDGNGTINATEAYVYDGNQIVLRFADDDAAALAAADLTNRYLWGPNVDQLLAEENVTSLGSAGTVDWALTDHLGTIRDWVRYNSGTSQTDHLDHAEYDAFGNRLDAASVDSLFGWTGRPFDQDTSLQWNGGQAYVSTFGSWRATLHDTGRWYDPIIGRWLSEDPAGFLPGDSNLYRYVANTVSSAVDPTGLWTVSIGIGFNFCFGIFCISGSVDVNLGPGGPSVSATAGGGPGLGLGGGVSVEGAITSAPNVQCLAGMCDELSVFGGFLGKGSAGIAGGRNPKYVGITGGIGLGLGAGGSIQGKETVIIF